MSKKKHVTLNVNGKTEEFLAEPRELLIYTLRERLNITGPHIGCETSHCGACTVTIDGKSVKSCTMFAVQAEGAEITTIEGIGGPDNLHPLQEAFKEHHGLQCGYCTPGMITRATRERGHISDGGACGSAREREYANDGGGGGRCEGGGGMDDRGGG